MDKFKSMEAFVAAAQSDSFSAAAVQLGVTPQLIAKHVRNLEEHLGLRLINRTTRRQGLTEFGQQYYARCKSILGDIEAADELALAASASPRGNIRISAPYNYGSHRLIPFLTQYLTEFPETDIELELTDRLVDLVQDRFEAVFRVGEAQLGDSATLIQRPLKPFRLLACASPAYIARKGTPTHPEELVDHDCLGYLFWDRMTDKVWEFSKDGQTFRVPVKSRLKVNSTVAKLNAALTGFGMTLCAEDMLRPYVERGELVTLLGDFDGPSRPVSLIYATDRRPSARLRHFIDGAVQALS